MGGGEGEGGGISGGGSCFLALVGVFPCKALYALCRSNVGVNHVYPCVRVLQVEHRETCWKGGP